MYRPSSTEELYSMPDDTRRHLLAWCDRETMTGREADALALSIITLLESFTEAEAEYSLNHGWAHVRNLL